MNFSIITPSFNQIDWLRLCVASVRDQVGRESQTERSVRIEHIIQDAGTPGIEDFAREIGADFHRSGQLVFPGENADLSESSHRIVIHSEADSGMYDAVNRGYARATGEVLAYLNCDEQYLTGTLAKVSEWLFANPAKSVLFGDALVVRSDGSYLCTRKVSRPGRLYTLVSQNLSIFTAATFIRKTVYDGGLRFDTRYKDVGDAVWALDVVRRNLQMGFFGSVLTAFTDTGDNMNMRPNAIREKEEMFLSAPLWARKFRHLFIGVHRFKRLLLGAYTRAPLDYSIFTMQSPGRRILFSVPRQTHKWRLSETG